MRPIGLAAGLLLAFVCEPARVVTPEVYSLHIERQPLDAALQEFARQTGMQILFYSHLADGRRASALHGKYTLDAGIAALLFDSQLTYRMVNMKTIEIVRERTRQ